MIEQMIVTFFAFNIFMAVVVIVALGGKRLRSRDMSTMEDQIACLARVDEGRAGQPRQAQINRD